MTLLATVATETVILVPVLSLLPGYFSSFFFSFLFCAVVLMLENFPQIFADLLLACSSRRMRNSELSVFLRTLNVFICRILSGKVQILLEGGF